MDRCLVLLIPDLQMFGLGWGRECGLSEEVSSVTYPFSSALGGWDDIY